MMMRPHPLQTNPRSEVKALYWASGFALLALFLSGCVTSKVDTHADDFDFAEIQPGKVTYHFKSGRTEEEHAPRESHWTIKNGFLSHAEAGLGYEGELGWDIFGLHPRPMVAARVAYLFDFGLAVGADENASLYSLDFRYKDLISGPVIGVPWDNPGQTIYGFKVALPFNF